MKTSTQKFSAKAFNGINRNGLLFGWTPQAELWNGRFAMIGFIAYLLWDLAGYSVLRDVLRILPPLPIYIAQ
jgi:Chlorophyll A-B binding protein